ncbi:MAG: ArsC/Spx/MgsR family protein [Pseudomonadota bacterium]
MTHLVFFEKPGCGGNARQRALLAAAGHTLERRNLLTAHWTRERLLDFLAPLPVAQWFNRAAPRVKSTPRPTTYVVRPPRGMRKLRAAGRFLMNGEVVPERLDADSALALLIAEPLLIRRPLMQRQDDGARLVGFDRAEVERFVGLGTPDTQPASLEGCAADPARAAPCQSSRQPPRQPSRHTPI